MKTKKYFTIAAAALILAACSNDNTPQVDVLKDTPITVTAGVEGMLTRAGHDASSLPAKFYLSVTQDADNTLSKYNYTNLEMTKGADNAYTAPASANLLWKDSNRDVAVNAYTTDGTTFTVQTDQSTAENVITSDLLGAVKSSNNTDVTITDDQIAINFRHLLCKLDVTFSWGTELATATDKAIKSVMYQGFGTDVTLDREACTVTSGTASADIKAYVNELTSEGIFAPQMGENPKVVVTTDIEGVDRVFSIGVKAPADGFASGNRYTMNVTIGGTSVENGSVTATLANGWETGDANGEADGTTGNMATN